MEFGGKVHMELLDHAGTAGRFGPAGEVFPILARSGIRFVEIPCGDSGFPAEVQQAARAAADCGLAVSLHPYFEGRLSPEVFGEQTHADGMLALLGMAQEVSERSSRPVTMVFHGGLANLEPHHVPLETAMQRAREFFRWLDGQLETFPGLQAFSETQMPYSPDRDEKIRLGETYQQCLELVEGTRIRYCWDFGHTVLAELFGFNPPEPPPEFIAKVGHLHVHDVSEKPAGGYADHRPLGEGLGRWRQYSRVLRETGYDRRILFEIDLMPYPDPQAAAAALERWIGMMEVELAPDRG